MRVLTIFAILGLLSGLAQTPPPKSPHRGGWIVGRTPVDQVHESYFYRVAAGHQALLQWRLGVATDVFGQMSTVDGIVKADGLGLAYVEGVSTQKISAEIRKNLDYNLTVEERAVVKNTLRTWGMRMPAYRLESFPADEASRRKVFEFAKDLGVETIIARGEASPLPALDKLATEFAVNVALEDGPVRLEGLSKRIGIHLDLRRHSLMAVASKDRLLSLTLTGGGAPALFGELYKLQAKPLYMSLTPTGDIERISDLRRNAAAFETAVEPWLAARVGEISRSTPTTGPARLTPEVREKIAAAQPKQAIVKPRKPRKLLVIDLCVGDGGHSTIRHGYYAFEQMAKTTGAFDPVFDYIVV
jgi:hypothetical protein